MVWAGDGFVGYYCWDCAGYRSGGFGQNILPWVLAGTPLLPDTPYGIVADWLEERGRTHEATYLRNLGE
jgi:hypothetical protein